MTDRFETRSLLPHLALFALLAVSPVNPAQGSDLEVTGSIRSLNLYGEASPAGLAPSYTTSSTRTRLDLDWRLRSDWQLEAAVDHQALWSNPGDLFQPQSAGVNRHIDLDKTWQHSQVWDSRLQVDRLNLRWRSDRLDMVIGRQPVGFGRIVLFSPLDNIAPFAPDAIDTDIRTGIDALRASVSYGLDGQLGGIFVWGDEARNNSSLLTWTDNRAGVDILAMGGSLRDRPMFGFGLAGSLGTLGLKGEIAHYEGREVNRPGGDLHADFTIGAIEAWYRFDMGLTLILQYLYNGPGADNPEEYPAAATSAPLQEGLTYLLGRNYLLIAPSCEPHPLATLNGLMIWNLDDASFLIRPTLVLNLADNAALELFWTLHHGDTPEPSVAFLPPRIESEFGLRGNNGGFFLKLFF